jgi:hypothetical protein
MLVVIKGMVCSTLFYPLVDFVDPTNLMLQAANQQPRHSHQDFSWRLHERRNIVSYVKVPVSAGHRQDPGKVSPKQIILSQIERNIIVKLA